MSFRWARLGRTYCGTFCDAQGSVPSFFEFTPIKLFFFFFDTFSYIGAVQNLGEQGVAISILWVAIITFALVFFDWNSTRVNRRLSVISLSISWLFMVSDYGVL
jgi:hypothetical protein